MHFFTLSKSICANCINQIPLFNNYYLWYPRNLCLVTSFNHKNPRGILFFLWISKSIPTENEGINVTEIGIVNWNCSSFSISLRISGNESKYHFNLIISPFSNALSSLSNSYLKAITFLFDFINIVFFMISL